MLMEQATDFREDDTPAPYIILEERQNAIERQIMLIEEEKTK